MFGTLLITPIQGKVLAIFLSHDGSENDKALSMKVRAEDEVDRIDLQNEALLFVHFWFLATRAEGRLLRSQPVAVWYCVAGDQHVLQLFA